MGSWHSTSAETVLQMLDSRRSGLTAGEVKERLVNYGPNELQTKKRTSPILVFLKQFLSPLIYVLLLAVILSIVLGHLLDAGVIAVAILVGAIIGFVQETRAQKAMEALIRMAAPKATVRRGAKVMDVPTREIVPGDIILLESGDKVPADARLIELSNLKVSESALTGESMPVEKHTRALDESTSSSDRKNLVFMGTAVSYGRATAVVINTGMSTEIGKIATAIGETKEEKTPLQKSISKLSRYLIIVFLAAASLLLVAGLLRSIPWGEIFLLAVAAAVSAIPEGLPAMVALVLAVGMRVMARRNAIIRRLVAVETLGSATVICSDKTGTLTLNEMTVRRIYVDEKLIEVTGEGYLPKGEFRQDGQLLNVESRTDLSLLLRISALCNDALLTREEECCEIRGDPTEGALVVAAAKAGIDKEKLEERFPRLDEIPFQSEKQYMATFHAVDGRKVVYLKGAPERLVSMSKAVLKPGAVVPINEPEKQKIIQASTAMAQEAMRVIAVAYADLADESAELNEANIRKNLVFVGMAGMVDPPREEVKEAVRLCAQAGIRVVMITGDHRVTAESVGRELDLPPGRAITGSELQAMSDADLSKQIEEITIFARIEPLQKLRIVDALKSHGHVVAMTGDGVNDAPALKSADIGIAMGITGTDVAKEASDMVLADDNFASVVAAVEEGRAIFNRLRNVLLFSISTSIGEILALVLAISFIGKAPLLAVQIIWINLVTGTLVTAPLGLERKSGDELKQPPRNPKIGLVFPGFILRNLFLALIMGVGVFLVFAWVTPTMNLDRARTITFCTMVVFEWFLTMNSRSDEHTVFKLGFFKNRWLLISILAAALLQLAVVYVPFLQIAFGTVPIGLTDWGIIILIGLGLFAIEETRKALFPKLFSRGKL
ncbi:MAG: HAD-IC family P-type ATPase [Dehalococcoidales bacterium]|nr:HAD-IC family P-type ATPase [Dehalococcoidales bacterium]